MPEIEFFENMASSPSNMRDQLLTEDVPKPHKRQLPQRHTKGIPKPTYEPKLSSNVKYSMSHYVSNCLLLESNMLCESIIYCIYS